MKIENGLKFFLVAVALTCATNLSGCGDRDSWMSGSYEGTSTVTRKADFYSTSGEVVSTGKGTVSFPSSLRTTRLDDNMPLPDCNLHFHYDEESKEYRNSEREFTGKNGNDGYGCKSVYGTKSSFDINIMNAKMKRNEKGEMEMLVTYEAKDLPNSSVYELKFSGIKKGWF